MESANYCGIENRGIREKSRWDRIAENVNYRRILGEISWFCHMYLFNENSRFYKDLLTIRYPYKFNKIRYVFIKIKIQGTRYLFIKIRYVIVFTKIVRRLFNKSEKTGCVQFLICTCLHNMWYDEIKGQGTGMINGFSKKLLIPFWSRLAHEPCLRVEVGERKYANIYFLANGTYSQGKPHLG